MWMPFASGDDSTPSTRSAGQRISLTEVKGIFGIFRYLTCDRCDRDKFTSVTIVRRYVEYTTYTCVNCGKDHTHVTAEY